MNKPIPAGEEFTAAMQQLSAEAEKTLPASPLVLADSALANNGASLAESVQSLEKALTSRLEQFAGEINKQVELIRNTESVNQQLFDSLHAELLKYRDNFVHESLQKPFIHDLVYLYDHLNGLFEQLSIAAQEKGTRSHVSQWRDNLENAIHSLVEILLRFEVHEIEPRERVDLAYHRVVSSEPAHFPEEDGTIVMRLKRGFVWRGS